MCKLRHSANESTSVEQNTFPTWGDATENSFAINNNMYIVTQRYISISQVLVKIWMKFYLVIYIQISMQIF